MKVCSIKVHISFWEAFWVLWPSSQLSGHLRQSFSSLVVPVCPGVAGRRVSLALGADDPGSPVDPALAQEVESKVVGMAGRVDVGPNRQGNALRAGGSDRSAGRDRLRSNPIVGKRWGCPHPHAHHGERAAPASTCHSGHALTSGTRTSGVVLCEGMNE